jgi:glyoxylase-like metal-dependent hydrolase (beta-lactamase superfamily II)
MQTDFLSRFEAHRPRESVDGVLSTHLHIDHVAWNTMLVDGQWQPTFPNAEYFFVRPRPRGFGRDAASLPR